MITSLCSQRFLKIIRKSGRFSIGLGTNLVFDVLCAERILFNLARASCLVSICVSLAVKFLHLRSTKYKSRTWNPVPDPYNENQDL